MSLTSMCSQQEVTIQEPASSRDVVGSESRTYANLYTAVLIHIQGTGGRQELVHGQLRNVNTFKGFTEQSGISIGHRVVLASGASLSVEGVTKHEGFGGIATHYEIDLVEQAAMP